MPIYFICITRNIELQTTLNTEYKYSVKQLITIKNKHGNNKPLLLPCKIILTYKII